MHELHCCACALLRGLSHMCYSCNVLPPAKIPPHHTTAPYRQYRTVQYGTVRYSTMQHKDQHHNAMQSGIIQCGEATCFWYLELCKGAVKVEDSIALLDQLAFFFAGRQHHGLHDTAGHAGTLQRDQQLGRQMEELHFDELVAWSECLLMTAVSRGIAKLLAQHSATPSLLTKSQCCLKGHGNEARPVEM